MPRAADRSSIDSLLESVIRLYAQAADAQLNYSCLLGLWQIAEAIAQPLNQSGDTSRIAARLSTLVRTPEYSGSGWLYTLKHVAEIRNDIVHRGIRDVPERDVALLKIVVDHAIAWLYNTQDSLPTRQHLEYYYTNVSLPDTRLTALSDAAGVIERSRRSIR